MPQKQRRLAPALHQWLGKVSELLHQMRPVAGDGVACIMTKAFQRLHIKAALTQQRKQIAVGACGKAVGVGKDQGLHGAKNGCCKRTQER